MQPAEISGRVKAHVARLNRNIEDMDALAWMIGQYTGMAYHDPNKYPKKPQMAKNKIGLPDEPEDEEIMKDKLTVFANVHNTIEGAR